MDKNKAATRIRELGNLTLDVTEKDQLIQEFSLLLTLITGAKFSQVNIFDQDTQYTIASDGALFPPLPKDDTFCTYTLDKEATLEIPDMTADDRVREHFAVTGEPHVRYYYGVPMITKNEIAIGTVCIIHDKKMELGEEQKESLQIVAKQITRHLELKNRIVASDKIIENQRSTLHKIVHDLRTPMSAIIGTLSTMDKEELSANNKQMLDIVMQSSKELVNYVNDTLNKALKEKREGSSFVTGDALKEKLHSLFDLQAKQKDIDFEILNELKEDEKITTLSSGDLVNIIGNLISNAIKFTANEGKVSVFIRYKNEEHQEYEICVRDNGKGMTPQQTEAIESGDYGKSEPGTNNEQGSGIGLYEAKRTLHENEGSFEIQSVPGQGTVFILHFPRQVLDS